MDDLQAMVDSLRLSEPSNGRQMDDLAELLKDKLGLNLDQSAYRQLAENMVNLSLEKKSSRQSNEQIPSSGFAPHPNSSFSNPLPSSFSSTGTGVYGYNTTGSILQNGSQASSTVISPNVTHRRGRSPARSNSFQSNNSRVSPMRQIFGGIPRAGVPASGTTTVKANIESKRTLSPAFFRRTKGNEEKKENEKSDGSLPGSSVTSSLINTLRLDQSNHSSQQMDQIHHSGHRRDLSAAATVRVDQSNGASPQRASRPQVPIAHGRSQSPHPSHLFTNSFTPIPPSSPSVNNYGTQRHSAPNSPMNNYAAPPNNYNAPVDRPPSRSGSPFNRPGLQEFDGSEAIASRSPQRENVSSSLGTSSNRPGVPLGHRRTRSIGVDADLESSRQPQIPRSFSKSPLRRPSAAPEQESDSIRQPAPPRSFSHSPRRDHRHIPKSEAMDAEFESSNGIALPDLSIPEFDNVSSTPTRYNAIKNGETEMETDDINAKTIPESAYGKHRRIDVGQFGNGLQQSPVSETQKTDDEVKFEIGTGSRANSKQYRVPIRRSYRPEESPADNRNEPTPSPTGTDTRDKIFSPMDVETPYSELTRSDSNVIGTGPPRPQMNRPPHRRHPSLDSHEQETMESYAPMLHGSFSQDAAETSPVPATSLNNPTRVIDYSGTTALINAKRDEARSFYLAGDYDGSINSYTDALQIAAANIDAVGNDSVALLLSNRAAALLMVGAFDASVFDCQLALQKTSVQRNKDEPFSADSGILLKIKLYTRMGRAYLKLGEYKDAFTAFENAVKATEEAMAFSCANHAPDVATQNQAILSQMNTEAVLGQSDSRRLHDACDKLNKLLAKIALYPTDRVGYTEALGCVSMALSIASGSSGLSETKLSLLANLKRWREIAGFCERLAAFNVRLDSIFREDLGPRNPFPGVSTAVLLKSNYFGNSREEDATTRDLKLNSKAAGEAVLRLPFSLAPFYLRALRLEERYPAADAALRALETYVQNGPAYLNLGSQYSWIAMERSKLNRTKQGRERGDELFRTQDFDLAATQYTTCLTIDAEGLPKSPDGTNAGGRLHAVLHCNRAACLMASKRFNAAVEEVTAALKIHPRYMKAILRRARCYSRLQQTEEGIAEYRRWLELVEEASKPNYVPSMSLACLFDGPNDVKSSEVTQVKKELDELYKAKRRNEAVSREEADRRREREKWEENFSSAWRHGNDAQQRRDQWHEQQDSTRRWDSFKNEGPRSQSQGRSRSQNEGSSHSSSGHHRSLSSSRSEQLLDYYSILNVSATAKMEDIKKAFRKLAVKYHPDKNKDESATEIFLRIKLAHDTLTDPVKRMQYDTDLRRNGKL